MPPEIPSHNPPSPETPREEQPTIEGLTEEELNLIAKEIFAPNSGWVNNAAEFYSNRDKVGGAERILLAPANAFENLVQLGISIFNKKTYQDLATLASAVRDEEARATLMVILGKGWQNCTTAEKTAFVVEMLSTGLVAGGVLSKLKTLLPATKLIKLSTAGNTRRLLTSIAAANPLDDIAMASTTSMAQTLPKTVGGK